MTVPATVDKLHLLSSPWLILWLSWPASGCLYHRWRELQTSLFQWPVCYCWNSPFVGLSPTFSSLKGLLYQLKQTDHHQLWYFKFDDSAWSLVSSPDSSPCAMRGNIWLQVQIFWGPYSGMPIRSASWINHVTSHALTMVTHLRKKHKCERWRLRELARPRPMIELFWGGLKT